MSTAMKKATRPCPAVAVKTSPAAFQSAAFSAAVVGAPVGIVVEVGAAAWAATQSAASVTVPYLPARSLMTMSMTPGCVTVEILPGDVHDTRRRWQR